jgi:hypothetical protein
MPRAHLYTLCWDCDGTLLKNNNTSDTVLPNTVVNNVQQEAVSETGLAIAVSAGDYLELKWVTPAWTTLPTNVRIHGVIYIQ